MLSRVFVCLSTAALTLASTTALRATSSKPVAVPANANTAETLSTSVRDYLVHNLPAVLYEKERNWGHTKPPAKGTKWAGKGERKDGKWTRVRVTAPDLASSLSLTIQNMQQPEPGRTTFDVAIAFDAVVDYEQQNWKNGIRLFSGSARARARLKATLACEATSRIDFKGLLPDLVFRLHVVKAESGYENFRLEHVAGVGGEAARLIGDAVRKGVEKWHPSVERKLLAKADAALEKAGKQKEVRIGMTKLMTAKSRPVTAAQAKPETGQKAK
jgi:hypothetical protein